MRYKCKCSYDGTLFHGFQIQKKMRTVQSEIESTLLLVLKQKIRIYPAGRTDTGVHAIGQVFHFDSSIEIEASKMKKAINSRLPKDIFISDVEITDNEFHARFSAKSKEYHYICDFGEYNPLYCNYRFYCRYRNIDFNIFEKAIHLYVGSHDFRYFSRSKKISDTVREIYSISCCKDGALVTVKIIGNGFIHNMIRIMIASAFEVARRKIRLCEIEKALAGVAPLQAPKKLPASGLYLINIDY